MGGTASTIFVPPSFNSGRWQRRYNPDLIFVSKKLVEESIKSFFTPIPHTQHRPIMCQLVPAIRPHTVSFKRRYNFKKANWQTFTTMLDERITTIDPVPEAYEEFLEVVQLCSRKTIPRGCRTSYIQGLSSETSTLLKEYQDLFKNDPFSDETISSGQRVISSISESKRNQWIKLMEEMDMGRNSYNAWRLLDTSAMIQLKPHYIATFLQIKLQVSSWRTANQIKLKLDQNKKLEKLCQENSILSYSFTMEDLNRALNKCKNGKAAGLDDICIEQLKRFGPASKQWLLDLFNNCINYCKIPKLWRKARVIAILKPGKNASDPKNYRPISLLCHLYKILERMILNRLSDVVDPLLISEQAGFRPGRSCTSQILHLTQYIEDGYENNKVTGVAFIDLTSAYDTVNHRILLNKVHNMTGDYKLTQMIECFLQNRRFFVEFQGQRSRWRNIKNGLPQGSVLAPILFNIYTNDQPCPQGTKSFIYADDVALAVQGTTFEHVEEKLSHALEILSGYYHDNQLKPNPAKTQVCAFHLKNRQAARKLQVFWDGKQLEHCFTPKYLGVTLDRALTYRKHCLNTKRKVSARNNILRKLSGTSWGTHPRILRTSAVALCYSAAEYACPVWCRSSHANQVDIALNETCRLVTGCLRSTPLDKVYCLAGIPPPDIRRECASRLEKSKALNLRTHALYGYQPAIQRLKSRKSFLHSTESLTEPPSNFRVNSWRSRSSHLAGWMVPSESLPSGHEESWSTWKTLNRLRSGVGRTKANMRKWGFASDTTVCECGEEQTMSHLLVCSLCPTSCTPQNVINATKEAVKLLHTAFNLISICVRSDYIVTCHEKL